MVHESECKNGTTDAGHDPDRGSVCPERSRDPSNETESSGAAQACRGDVGEGPDSLALTEALDKLRDAVVKFIQEDLKEKPRRWTL